MKPDNLFSSLYLKLTFLGIKYSKPQITRQIQCLRPQALPKGQGCCLMIHYHVLDRALLFGKMWK